MLSILKVLGKFRGHCRNDLFASYVHYGWAIQPPEVVGRYPKAEPDHGPAYDSVVRSMRHQTPEVTAHKPTHRHRQTVSPIHQTLKDEYHHRHASQTAR